MPSTTPVKHQFTGPGSTLSGIDTIVLPVTPGKYADNVRVVFEVKNAASASLVNPAVPQIAGPQVVLVAWALAPAPGSHVRYRIEWTEIAQAVPNASLVLYQHINFGGGFLPVSGADDNLVPEHFNDKTSSLVVVRGVWMFFKDIHFQDPFTVNGAPVLLGPGHYPWVEAVGLQNDTLSSLRAVA